MRAGFHYKYWEFFDEVQSLKYLSQSLVNEGRFPLAMRPIDDVMLVERSQSLVNEGRFPQRKFTLEGLEEKGVAIPR